MTDVTIKPHSNFTSLKGNNIPENASEEYMFYRKCWNEYPKNFTLKDMPLHLDIEASSYCNLRCTFCDKRPMLGDQKLGNLDFALFKHIIDQFDQ